MTWDSLLDYYSMAGRCFTAGDAHPYPFDEFIIFLYRDRLLRKEGGLECHEFRDADDDTILDLIFQQLIRLRRRR